MSFTHNHSDHGLDNGQESYTHDEDNYDLQDQASFVDGYQPHQAQSQVVDGLLDLSYQTPWATTQVNQLGYSYLRSAEATEYNPSTFAAVAVPGPRVDVITGLHRVKEVHQYLQHSRETPRPQQTFLPPAIIEPPQAVREDILGFTGESFQEDQRELSPWGSTPVPPHSQMGISELNLSSSYYQSQTPVETFQRWAPGVSHTQTTPYYAPSNPSTTGSYINRSYPYTESIESLVHSSAQSVMGGPRRLGVSQSGNGIETGPTSPSVLDTRSVGAAHFQSLGGDHLGAGDFDGDDIGHRRVSTAIIPQLLGGIQGGGGTNNSMAGFPFNSVAGRNNNDHSVSAFNRPPTNGYGYINPHMPPHLTNSNAYGHEAYSTASGDDPPIHTSFSMDDSFSSTALHNGGISQLMPVVATHAELAPGPSLRGKRGDAGASSTDKRRATAPHPATLLTKPAKRSRWNYNREAATRDQPILPNPSPMKTSPTTAPSIRCPQCFTSFDTEKSLKGHMKKEHAHIPCPCACFGCIYKSSDVNERKRHFKTMHYKEEVYKCTEEDCDRETPFSRPDHVREHIRKMHTPKDMKARLPPKKLAKQYLASDSDRTGTTPFSLDEDVRAHLEWIEMSVSRAVNAGTRLPSRITCREHNCGKSWTNTSGKKKDGKPDGKTALDAWLGHLAAHDPKGGRSVAPASTTGPAIPQVDFYLGDVAYDYVGWWLLHDLVEATKTGTGWTLKADANGSSWRNREKKQKQQSEQAEQHDIDGGLGGDSNGQDIDGLCEPDVAAPGYRSGGYEGHEDHY